MTGLPTPNGGAGVVICRCLRRKMSHKHAERREAALSDMTTGSKRLIRLQATERLIELGSRAIYITSLKQCRFTSLRIAMVFGLERLRDDAELRKISHLKHFKKHELAGPLRIHLGLNPDECLLMNSVKALLQTQSASPVTTNETLCIALIAANASASVEDLRS